MQSLILIAFNLTHFRGVKHKRSKKLHTNSAKNYRYPPNRSYLIYYDEYLTNRSTINFLQRRKNGKFSDVPLLGQTGSNVIIIFSCVGKWWWLFNSRVLHFIVLLRSSVVGDDFTLNCLWSSAPFILRIAS